jgi:hypothetical protein
MLGYLDTVQCGSDADARGKKRRYDMFHVSCLPAGLDKWYKC